MSDEMRGHLASRALACLAVYPQGLGGALLRGPPSPARDAWIAALRGVMPDVPWRRMPPQISDGRLIGGLDLTATLTAGRPVMERGLLAEADGGMLVVPMAERLGGSAAGLLAAALDSGEVIIERDGLASCMPAHCAALLLDEGGEDEGAPNVLTERVAFMPDVRGLRPNLIEPIEGAAIDAARRRMSMVAIDDDVVEALAVAGVAFGVLSLRIATFAVRVAKAAAAYEGRLRVSPEDAELAAALVIAPRATQVPSVDPQDEDEAETPPPNPSNDEPESNGSDQTPGEEKPLSDSVVEATRAAIPPALLAMLTSSAAQLRRTSTGGRGGAPKPSALRGRPAGTRRGQPGRGVRLSIVDTLRAAAPWQRLRRETAANPPPNRLLIRRDDFRVARFKQRSETVTIFVVDASGSAALHRLAEVKGAVELILAECYVRRDSVALIAFRGARAELVLPPTRSLARAKRALAAQAGGGGTPLASAIDAAAGLAERVRRAGQTPMVVVLTDGKANIARSGQAGRGEAETDARDAAQAFRVSSAASLVLDIAPRPAEAAARLAHIMGARYVPLPYADARGMSQVVLAATPVAKGNI